MRGVVFMGMGEPFLNYDNVLRAANILCEPAGMAISAKAITISTAGVVPMIRRFTEEGHRFRLIVSLGAPSSEERLPLMPIEKRWPLPELMDAIRAYAATLSGRVTLAYVGIGGRNLTPGARPAAGGADHRAAGEDQPDRRQRRQRALPAADGGGGGGVPRRDVARGDPGGAPVLGGREIGAACGTLSASQRGGQLVQLR